MEVCLIILSLNCYYFFQIPFWCEFLFLAFPYSLKMDFDCDFCNASSAGQNLEHLATGGSENKSYRLVAHEDHEGTLYSIWYKATGICQSSQLKTFLRKKGKLSSLHVDQSTSCNFFLFMFLMSCYSFSIILKLLHHAIYSLSFVTFSL